MAGENQYVDLMTDLIYLRKDAGFTPRRMRMASTFLEIMGGDGQTYETLKTRLVSAVNALPSQQDTDILLAAMALSGEFEKIPLLKHRRELLGRQTGYTPDTIAEYENAAIQELALYLLAARYAASPLPEGIPALHSTAIHERVFVTTLVRDKLWAETREFFRSIPLIDEVEYFEISSDIPAHVTADSDIVVKSETTGSGRKHRFYFSQPLQRGKPAELRFTMQPDGTRDEELVLQEDTRSFHLPTISSGMEILFLGEKPSQIWHYAQLPLFERPGLPVRERLMDLGGGSSVRVEWNELHGGLYSGIAWAW